MSTLALNGAAPTAALEGLEPSVPKLSFDRVTKGFAGATGWTPAIKDFTLHVEPGEFICLVGPSGCGKTTVLNLAAGFIRPEKGQVLLDGKPVAKPGPDRALVFQENALFPWLTVRGNVEFGLELAKKPRKQRQVLTDFYLKLVHLDRFQHSFIHELSGGMKQRVQLARALALMPAVFLMDEPFAALDALTRDRLYGEVQHILAETKQTVLFITHNVREAVILGDRVIVMGGAHPGSIKAEFKVELPRPRTFSSPGINELINSTMALLKSEQDAAEEEPTSVGAV